MIALFGRKVSGTGILRNLSAGGEGSSGCEWVTNGKEEKLIACGSTVPVGWQKGRKDLSAETFRKLRARDKHFWITDGTTERRVKKEDPIPEGWLRGRLNFSPEARLNMSKVPKRCGWRHPPEVIEKLRLAALKRESQYMWITDGRQELWVLAESTIPEGWSRGRKPRKASLDKQHQ